MTRSTSVLKSIIIPSKSSKNLPANDGAKGNEIPTAYGGNHRGEPLMLPDDHPHAGMQDMSNAPLSPRKSSNFVRPRIGDFYSRGKSSDYTATLKEEQKKSRREKSRDAAPTKSKSSTSLASLFKNNRSSKDLTSSPSKPSKDKENTTPPRSASYQAPAAPIWAQFATQQEPVKETTTTSKIPLNDLRSKFDEIQKYTPQKYREGKQKDFCGHDEPRLGKRSTRPRSIEIAASTAKSLLQPIVRKTSLGRKFSDERRHALNDKKEESKKEESKTATVPASSPVKRKDLPQATGHTVSRVQAAVANYNGKAKEAEMDELLTSKNIDAAFEAVLESRQIPEPMREKMRTLKPSVKADFIRSHKVERLSTPPEEAASPPPEKDVKKSVKDKESAKSRNGDKDAAAVDDDEAIEDGAATPKRSRPRSRAFTFSKGDSSPTKKQKGDTFHRRDKSVDKGRFLKSPSTTSLVGVVGGTGTGEGSVRSQKAARTTAPSEFIFYLHETTRPEDVEVGRLHKLRLLLRNETVAWVDAFIREGGMTEILALLHRIMEVEWREEHEDALLHEALLCLKGLTTTELALQKLCEVAPTLFPSLLGMLFDKERKGPSEFATRQIVINILFTHLSAAPPAQLHARARTILSYLRDPAPPEQDRPAPFLLEMRQPRPYLIWHKEVADVTKEVFWIFLHQLNVISLPSAPTDAPKAVENSPPPESAISTPPLSAPVTTTTSIPPATPRRPQSSHAATGHDSTYTTRHFPPQRAPVPAAPYVGGVEWDATNYLAAHLDLLNGLVASLATRDERNELRALLRASGWEKAMGNTLRTCKEKFYGAVHACLRTWVGAGAEDGWPVADVRFGLREEEAASRCVRLSPKKKREREKGSEEAPPRLDVPPLGSLGLKVNERGGGGDGKIGFGFGADEWKFDI